MRNLLHEPINQKPLSLFEIALTRKLKEMINLYNESNKI
jgi:hypothetical protein